LKDEKGDIRSQPGRQPHEGIRVQPGPEKIIQGRQHGGGVAASPAQSGGNRNPLPDPDLQAFGNPGFLAEELGGPPGQVVPPQGNCFPLGDQPDSLPARVNFHLIGEIDPLQEGLDLMVSIRPLFQHLQMKVDFCRGKESHS
jgi:hypothetical protein